MRAVKRTVQWAPGALLCAAAVVLLSARFYVERGERSVNPLAVEDGAPVDLMALLSPERGYFGQDPPRATGADRLALFVLSPTACSACLSEAHEYAELISRWPRGGGRTVSLGILLESDPFRASHFVATTNLPFTMGFGLPEELAEPLTRFAAGDHVRQQIAFVNPKDGIIFYRVALPNFVSSLDEKRRILRSIDEHQMGST